MKSHKREKENRPPLADPEATVSAIYEKTPRHIRLTFLATLVLGLVVHLYFFTNKLPNHDDIGHIFGSSYGAASGRWLLSAVLKLDGEFSAPWLIGLISLVLLGVSACFIVSIFRIRRPLGCILCAGILVSFPAVASTFSYMFSADAYFLGLTLACFGAYIAGKYRFGFLGAGVAICLSLGIYQSYFGTAAALLIALLIFDTLDGRLSLGQLLLKGAKFLGALVLGLVLYFIAVKLTTPPDGLSDYMGISTMGTIQLSQLPQLIFNAYYEYIRFFLHNVYGVHFAFLKIVFSICALAGLIVLVYILQKKRLSLGKTLLLAALCVAFPLAANLIFIMAPHTPVHMLMLYNMVLILVVPVAIWEYSLGLEGGETAPKPWTVVRSLSCWVIAIGLALTSYSYFVFSNSAYLKMEISYEQTYAYSNRLLSAIISAEDYSENVPVVLVGKALNNVQFPASPELDKVQLTGVPDEQGLINSYTYGYFLRRFLGAENIIYDTATKLSQDFADLNTVKQMPLFPAEGSIKAVDGFIVVKLG